MTGIFKKAKMLMNEALDKVILKEEDEKFVSVAQQDDAFDASKINANLYDNPKNLDPDKETEKNKLTSQAIKKIKQNLKVSDELQSILNRIDKLNKEIDSNDWQINEEDNTAILRNKNARIFKQNENLCLSHNGIVEIFKSVPELHEWLKKNNYPLPKNIKLHESILSEDNEELSPDEEAPIYDFSNDDSQLSRLKNRYKNTRWAQIIGKRWGDLGKVIDVMTPEERAEQLRQNSWSDTYKNINKMSREQEKMARQKAGIEQNANPYKDQSSLEPRLVWNDLHSGMGNFLSDTDAYKQHIDQMKKDKADKAAVERKAKKDAEKAAKEQTKTEALDDNQLDNNEVWYLEYQTNIPEEKSYLNKAWKESDLLTDNLDQAAKFISRNNAMAELQELYASRQTPFPFKPVTGDEFEECGVGCATTTAGLGSAVQYVGNKKESLKEDDLEEAQRQDFKDRVALDRELIKIANIKDFDGNVIGKAGKTIEEYAANRELGFDDQKDPQGYVTYTTEDGKDIRIDDKVLNRRIALDVITGQPMGMIDTTGKVRNLKGNKIIGYSDTREAAKNRGIDLDKLGIDSEHDDNFQFTQKAGQQWAGKRDSITNKYVNKIGFFNPETGEIKNKYKDAWSELTKDNAKLRNNPEIMHDMFTDYIKDGKPVDPETFKKRILEINDVFGINLSPEDEIIPSKMKKNSPQQQEFYKWRDNYYKPLFNASRRKNKATNKINADRDNFAKEQDEWRASANDRADQEQGVQYFINDMNDKAEQFVNRKIGGFDLVNSFKNFANNDAIPTRIKSSMAQKIYATIEDEQGPDMANMFKMINKDLFNQQESVLTEDDTPADFADGPTNVASDMSSIAGQTSNTIDTQTDASPEGLDDYGPEDSGMGDAPSFGDININSGAGPDEETPMPAIENKKIVDILVNEADPTQIKLKVKDLDSGKIEIKDLDEIDI
nr:MAG TPA: hypothetical protein [Caudoviricetes sp.]